MKRITQLCAALVVVSLAASSHALEKISENELASSTGEGIAMIAENFSLASNDTGYINYIPRGPVGTGTKSDAYLYGLSVGASDAAGTASRSVGTISSWGTATNPFLLTVGTASVPGLSGAVVDQPYLRFKAPDFKVSADKDYNAADYNLKLAFWADYVGISNDKVVTPNGVLRLQAVADKLSINGTQVNMLSVAGGGTVPAADTQRAFLNTMGLGLTGIIRLNSDPKGVFRVSTGEGSSATGPATPLVPSANAIFAPTAPTFNATEGIYIGDLDVNLPLGRLGYQPLVARGNGRNLVLELPLIPNNEAAYKDFYTDYSGNDPSYKGTLCSSAACDAKTATHGQISIGNVTFKDGKGGSVDVGSSQIDGLLIQHMKVSTTGL